MLCVTRGLFQSANQYLLLKSNPVKGIPDQRYENVLRSVLCWMSGATTVILKSVESPLPSSETDTNTIAGDDTAQQSPVLKTRNNNAAASPAVTAVRVKPTTNLTAYHYMNRYLRGFLSLCLAVDPAKRCRPASLITSNYIILDHICDTGNYTADDKQERPHYLLPRGSVQHPNEANESLLPRFGHTPHLNFQMLVRPSVDTAAYIQELLTDLKSQQTSVTTALRRLRVPFDQVHYWTEFLSHSGQLPEDHHHAPLTRSQKANVLTSAVRFAPCKTPLLALPLAVRITDPDCTAASNKFPVTYPFDFCGKVNNRTTAGDSQQLNFTAWEARPPGDLTSFSLLDLCAQLQLCEELCAELDRRSCFPSDERVDIDQNTLTKVLYAVAALLPIFPAWQRYRHYLRILDGLPKSFRMLLAEVNTVGVPSLCRPMVWCALLGIDFATVDCCDKMQFVEAVYNAHLDLLNTAAPNGGETDTDSKIIWQEASHCKPISKTAETVNDMVLLLSAVENIKTAKHVTELKLLAVPLAAVYSDSPHVAYECFSQLFATRLRGYFESPESVRCAVDETVNISDRTWLLETHLALFCKILTFFDPELALHLMKIGVTSGMLFARAFTTLFASSFDEAVTILLWDALLAKPPVFVVFVGLVLVRHTRQWILRSDTASSVIALISLASCGETVDVCALLEESQIFHRNTPDVLLDTFTQFGLAKDDDSDPIPVITDYPVEWKKVVLGVESCLSKWQNGKRVCVC
eukprot:Lankesteria_metandrocarpae@DN10458_c0_g1_i1.p1